MLILLLFLAVLNSLWRQTQILFLDTVIRIQEGKNKHTALVSWSDSASLMVFYKGSKTYYAWIEEGGRERAA